MQSSSMAEPHSSEIKSVILELARNNPSELQNDVINAALPHTSLTTIASVINELLEEGNLILFVNKDKVPFYKYGSPMASSTIQLKDLKLQEEVVFRLIRAAGNKGILAKDITSQVHLTKVEQSKILRSLKSKNLIKDIVVPGSKLKCYILHNLEHVNSNTNSYWYDNQDKTFLTNLNQWCMEYLENKSKTAEEAGGGPLNVRNNSYVLAADVYQYITDVKHNTVPLTVTNVENILYTFVLDDKLEREKNAKDEYLYKTCSRLLPPPGITKSPCGGCPVRHKCGKVGSITPQTCKYFDDWLEK